MRLLKYWFVSSAVLWLMAGFAFAQMNPGTSNPCKATASAPTYAEGSKQPLSCDLAGTLRTTAGGSGGAGDASAANQTTIIGHIDGLEGLLTTLSGYVDGLETLITSTNTKLDSLITAVGTTLAGYLDGVEGLLTTGNSNTSAIKTAVELIDDDQTGASINHRVSVGTTEDETQIKATAGRLLSIQITNSAATVAYFRCANLTAASTTPGSSTVFYGLAVPGATTGAGIVANFGPMGIAFSTALTCWVVTGKAESDVTEVGANDVQWNIQYK